MDTRAIIMKQGGINLVIKVWLTWLHSVTHTHRHTQTQKKSIRIQQFERNIIVPLSEREEIKQ
jgi:hypothetical protein